MPVRARHNIVWGLKDGTKQKTFTHGHHKTKNLNEPRRKTGIPSPGQADGTETNASSVSTEESSS
jgi:hypothetical protein